MAAADAFAPARPKAVGLFASDPCVFSRAWVAWVGVVVVMFVVAYAPRHPAGTIAVARLAIICINGVVFLKITAGSALPVLYPEAKSASFLLFVAPELRYFFFGVAAC